MPWGWLRPCGLGLMLALASCNPVRNPATGELQYTALTPADEARIGREEHPQVLAQFGGPADEPALRAYVERIGQNLVRASETPGQSFTFTVLDSDIVNAFALPGGFVYVSRGLVALCDNEAELAGVLGHEIGHVTARHTAQRYDRQIQGQLGATAAQLGGLILGGILGGDVGARLGGQLGGQLGSAGATAYVQGYSREQEFAADELGVRYLAGAGYDRQAMATFLATLSASDALERRLEGRNAEAVPNWQASHPRTLDRVERAIAAAGGAGAGGELGRDSFLGAIDGMVFGDSPAQGFVRGDRFIHPGLGLAFTAPVGFTLKNTPAAVIGTDRRGRFMIFDAAARTNAGTPVQYLQAEWIKGQRLRGLRPISVGGREGALGFGRVSFQNRPAEAMFAVVEAGNGGVYRFVFLRQGTLGAPDAAAFETSLQSLAPLSPSEAAAFKPLRIKVVAVAPGDTIDSLSARMAVDQAPRDWFVLLNDLDQRPLTPGQRVKLVVRG